MINVLVFHANIKKGGIERQIKYLFDYPSKNIGYKLLFAYYGKREKNISQSKINAVYIRWIFGNSRKKYKYLFYPFFILKLVFFVVHKKIDIIHTYGPIENITASFLKLFLRIPIVVSVRTTAKDAFRLARVWGNISDFIITNSYSIREILLRKYSIKNKKIRVIRNGIDNKKFYFCKANKYKRKDVYNFALVGRFSRSKNQIDAIKAFSELNKEEEKKIKLGLLLIGRIDDNKYYEKIIEYIKFLELQDKIEIITWIDNIEYYYHTKIDCLILTSLTEGLPNVILEAMSTGVPWISYDVADTRYLAGNNFEYGVITKENTSKELLREMKSMINTNHSELKRKMKRAREFVEKNYTIEDSINKILSLYKHVILKEERTRK